MNHIIEESLASKWSQTTDIAILERSRVRALEMCAEQVLLWREHRLGDIKSAQLDRLLAMYFADEAAKLALEIDTYRPNNLPGNPLLGECSAEPVTPATGDVISERPTCGSTGQVAGGSFHIVCAWCGGSIGGDHKAKIGHGICLPCKDRQLAEMKNL